MCCFVLLLIACQGSVSEPEGVLPAVDDADASVTVAASRSYKKRHPATTPAGSAGIGSSAGSAGAGGDAGNSSMGGTPGLGDTGGTSSSSSGGTSGGSSGVAGSGSVTDTGGTISGSGGMTGGSGDVSGGGGVNAPTPVLPDPVKNPAGFTVLTKSADTQVIYVSTSGSDSNDGLSEQNPLKTASAGLKKLRDGHADWVLFKRGDAFESGLGNFKGSGRSATEPMVISAYGSGDRPVFRSGSGTGLSALNDSAGSATHDHVWIIGLDFYANRRDPADPNFSTPGDTDGIKWRVGTTDLLIEDCVVRFYGVGMTFQDGDNLGISGVRLRRNHFLDSYNTAATHSQGIYIYNTNGVLFEENIFDHNGWNETVSGAGKTIYNHNIYCDNKNTNVVMKNNIFLRASSHGVQLRAGGIADGNLFVYNAISLLLGGGTDPNPGGVDGEANDNVVLLGTDIGSAPKQYGIDMANIHAFQVGNNIVANSTTSMAASPLKTGISGVTYASNIVYNWPLGKSTGGSYPDASRDLASYDATLGGPGTFENFVQGLRSQSQQSWRTEYMAQTINAYIREGFTP
jgi:hypothetical protein